MQNPTNTESLTLEGLAEAIGPALSEEGQGGDGRTFYAAAVLVVDFGLPFEEALPLLAEWNLRCSPPWTLAELAHKLKAAQEKAPPAASATRWRGAWGLNRA